MQGLGFVINLQSQLIRDPWQVSDIPYVPRDLGPKVWTARANPTNSPEHTP